MSALLEHARVVAKPGSSSLCEGPGKSISTNSAVSNATENVLHVSRPELRIDGLHRCDTAQGTIGTLEPPQSSLTISEKAIGDGYDPSEPIEPIGLVGR